MTAGPGGHPMNDMLYGLSMDPRQLMAVKVDINGKQFTAMLDSGASRVYVAKQTAHTAGLAISTAFQRGLINFPDGSRVAPLGQADLDLGIGRFRCCTAAVVMDLPAYDLILGIEFLRQYKVVLNFADGTVELMHGTKDQEILDAGICQPHLAYCGTVTDNEKECRDLMSYRAALQPVDEGAECYLALIQQVDGEEALTATSWDAAAEPAAPWQILPTMTENSELNKVIAQFHGIFKKDIPVDEKPEDIPTIRTADTALIDTGTAPPVNLQAYYLSAGKLVEQSRQIRQLLEQGLIKPSSSAWGFPVLFVKKSDGTWRMCIDYRALNAVTSRNGYPLPRIQECLDVLGTAKVFSKIDLTSGYWQIRLPDGIVSKTAFNTREGKFEWLVMPFGLKNAPSVFQTIVNRILMPFLNQFVVVYLDDILIYSHDVKAHVIHVRQVLQVLSDNKLYAKPSKCSFGIPEVEFCGHIVGQGTVRPMPQKLDVIRQWPRPITMTDLKAFLGLCTYYRRYSKDFSAVSVPLFELLKTAHNLEKGKKDKYDGKRRVDWHLGSQHAFDAVKDLLCSAPALRQPDPSKPYRLETDASDWAIGCVLLQQDEKTGIWHPVAYDGRKLNDAERGYPTHEKELLAMRHGLRAFDRYIDNGTTTTVVTDHNSLKYLPTTKIASRRLASWVADFGEYDLDIQYRAGKDNVIADAISRRSDFVGTITEGTTAVNAVDGSMEHVIEHMTAYLKDGTLPDGESRQKIIEESIHYVLGESDLLLRKLDGTPNPVPVIDLIHRQHLLSKMHDNYGHLGFDGMRGILRQRGWWPSIDTDTRRFVKTCAVCQVSGRSRTSQEREYAVVMAQANIQPFERWGIDLIGKLPKTVNGNQWIVTAIDYATGWPLAKALPDAKAPRIADFIYEEIFEKFGAPREVISDNGRNLLAPVVEHLFRSMGSRHWLTTAYHPRTNGKVESFNGMLGRTLTKLLVGKPTRLWDSYLSSALFACRIRTHSTAGRSPFYLVYGVHPRLPSDENEPRALEMDLANPEERLPELRHERQRAADAIYQRAVKHKAAHDKLVKAHEFKTGDSVLLRHENPQKFVAKWFGPYKIVSQKTLGTYELSTINGQMLRQLVHGNRLLPCYAREGDGTQLWNNPAIRQAFKEKTGETWDLPSTASTADIERSIEEEYDDEPTSIVRSRRVIIPYSAPQQSTAHFSQSSAQLLRREESTAVDGTDNSQNLVPEEADPSLAESMDDAAPTGGLRRSQRMRQAVRQYSPH